MIKVKEITATLIPIIIGGLIALVIKTFLVTAISVDGSSMAPNLYANETVVLLRHARVKRNQIVVFKAAGVDKNNHYLKPNTLYIKRVIGMPGDRIRYSKQGNLYINGKYQAQSYISPLQRKLGTTLLNPGVRPAKGIRLGSNRTFKVPAKTYFVLGDNRTISNDSRYYGFVPAEKIQGVAKAFPWSRNHQLVNSYK